MSMILNISKSKQNLYLNVFAFNVIKSNVYVKVSFSDITYYYKNQITSFKMYLALNIINK